VPSAAGAAVDAAVAGGVQPGAMFDLKALETAAAGPRAILRVVQVLGHLAQHPQGCTLAQLCADLQLPKTTLFTMLKTLHGSGHLLLTDSVYRIGPAAVTLGQALAGSARRGFPECTTEALTSLCRRTGETGILAVLTADGMFCNYVSVIESGAWLRYSVQPNSLKPAYATGTGHAMLAWLPPADLAAILARTPFEKMTAKTVASRRTLLQTLKTVRRTGISISDSGTVLGALSVAAPIFDAQGRIFAAVSAGGPTARMQPQLGAIERAVRATAEEISQLLGYAGEWPAP